eukprot:GILI01017337.1.p1 GENE.GILI01017337.1~~GILI01017337.1.p1  ORF type:complete len:102 (+),score=3.08 GILI01017337.1:69-374(+)
MKRGKGRGKERGKRNPSRSRRGRARRESDKDRGRGKEERNDQRRRQETKGVDGVRCDGVVGWGRRRQPREGTQGVLYKSESEGKYRQQQHRYITFYQPPPM